MLHGFLTKPRIDSKCSFPYRPLSQPHSFSGFLSRKVQIELVSIITKAFPWWRVSVLPLFFSGQGANITVCCLWLPLWLPQYLAQVQHCKSRRPRVGSRESAAHWVRLLSLWLLGLSDSLEQQGLVSFWLFRSFPFGIQKVKFPMVIAGPVFRNVSLLIHRVVFMMATVRLA